MRRAFALALVAAALAGCRGPNGAAPSNDLARLVDSLTPAVERAAGMRFTERPRSAIKTRAEVGRYILEQLDRELPRAKRDGLQTAYRLLGFLPDTFDLDRALLALYSEQVAGYYDPETKTLYGVSDDSVGAAGGTGGADPRQSRLVIAHELVHALQGQRLPLAAMLHDTLADADRRSARQAVLEGQATLASIEMLAPDAGVVDNDAFWDAYREQVSEGSGRLPIFRDAPAVLRLGLIFPYVQGAEFMRWWVQTHGRDSQPYGAFPESSEQILHPDRYARGDRPVTLRFAGAEPVVFEDAVGEAEMVLLSDLLTGTERASGALALGWGGDRYRVLRTPGGPAVDWAMVFDEPRYAERYQAVVRALAARRRPGYRAEVRPLTVAGKTGFRVVIAPEAWDGWTRLPEVTAVS